MFMTPNLDPAGWGRGGGGDDVERVFKDYVSARPCAKSKLPSYVCE